MKKFITTIAVLLMIFGVGSAWGYDSVYPPAQNDTYVKATSRLSVYLWPYFATNPTKSLVGEHLMTSWVSSSTPTNQRFHIDLGSAKPITRIYYENFHYIGTTTDYGVRNFTFWGSNTAGDFADLVYTNDGTWVQLTTVPTAFERHVGSNTADPKYITVTNSTPYRYYAFKFADNYGNATYMGVRRIELQVNSGISFNLVGYWPLTNQWMQNATTVSDLGSGGNNGTVIGASVGSTSTAFDGTGDYIDIDNEVSLTGAFTMSAWINMEDPPLSGQYPTIIGGGDGGTEDDDGFRIHTTNDSLQIRIGASLSEASTALNPGSWYFAVVTRDNSDNVKYYLNGNDDTSGSPTSADDFVVTDIGRRDFVIPWYFDGQISDVRIYNRALSPADVSELYNLGRNAMPNAITAGVSLSGVGVNSPLVSATGGTVTYDGDYKIHTFTEDGTLTVTNGGEVEYLVVGGGGGGGGACNGAGGGAGGFLTGTLVVSIGEKTVTVGAGGPGGIGYGATGNNTGLVGTSGYDSVFDTITATGGGGGGCYNAISGGNGGSGGGEGNGPAIAGTGIEGQGHDGGLTCESAQYGTGGGGGAGAVGGDGSSTEGGVGGVGLPSSISGSVVYYAGGGGGSITVIGTPGAGGNGGGGAGSISNGFSATANTGGGGGGAERLDGGTTGGAGGSGIVIIRYKYKYK